MNRVLLAALLTMATAAIAQDQPSPEVQGHLDRGNELLQRRQYDEAIGEFKRANKQSDGKCSPCLSGLMRAYRSLGAHKDAVATAEKLIELAPNDRTKSSLEIVVGLETSLLADDKKAKREDAEQAFRTALRLNPENNIAHYNLGFELMKEGRDPEGAAELKTFIDEAPNDRYANQARQLIENPRRAREPFAPDFSFVTRDGEYITSDDIKGKVILLDFWATWCVPCQEALPTLQRLAHKYGKREFMLVSVSGDSNEQAWRNFIEQRHMDWPQVYDRDHKIHQLFQIRPIPTYVVIDAEGIMRPLVIGSGITSAEQLEDEVKKSLKQAEKTPKPAAQAPSS